MAPTPAPATKDASTQRTDAAPGDGADTQAAATFDTPNPGDRLRYAVGVLEGQGAIARLLGALSDQQRSSEGSSSSKLLLVLAAREPSRNLALIEKLLSYGLFDWCVRDGEARFAYLLVRSLPLDAQERWKRLDDGKWFQRLEDNIPAEDVLEGRYRGVGKGAGAFDPKTVDKLTTDATAAVKEIDAAVRQGLSGPKAVELFRRLLQLGRTGTTGSRGEGDRQRLLQTAVQRLDTLGHMDRLLAELPDAYLLNEMWRSEVLEVLAVRDPRHLERQARALLSYGIFDWAVTAREAWLAYQLVRSLPAADQTRLEEEDPDRWARIKSNMTTEMRSSHGITAIAAAAGLKARERIRDKLRDRRLWVPARETELRSLIIQLYALDDRRWVFLQSRDVRADKVKGLGTLVTDLGLYDEITNPHFEPEALRAPQQLAETFGAIGRFLVSTPQIFGLLGDILGALLSPEMRLDDVDLELVQYILGGDIEGAKLAPREAGKSQAKKAVTAAGKTQGTKSRQTKDGKDTERRIDTNKVSIWIRPAEGRLGLELDSLDLASLMHIMPGMSVRTGKATLRGLRIVTDFSDRGYHRPAAASLDAEQIDITDIVLATAETLVAATRLMLQPLHLKAGQRGTEDLTVPAPPKTIPIPVIGPLLNALSHILALTGTIPGLSSIGGALISPLTAGSGFVAEQFSSLRRQPGRHPDRRGRSRADHRRHVPQAAHGQRAGEGRRRDAALVRHRHRRDRPRGVVVRRPAAGAVGHHQGRVPRRRLQPADVPASSDRLARPPHQVCDRRRPPRPRGRAQEAQRRADVAEGRRGSARQARVRAPLERERHHRRTAPDDGQALGAAAPDGRRHGRRRLGGRRSTQRHGGGGRARHRRDPRRGVRPVPPRRLSARRAARRPLPERGPRSVDRRRGAPGERERHRRRRPPAPRSRPPR